MLDNEAAEQKYLDDIKRGKNLPVEKKIYFNGFSIQINPPDFSFVLLQDKEPVALLHSSHLIAKTLGKAILGIIKDFEKNSNSTIRVLEDFSEKKKA